MQAIAMTKPYPDFIHTISKPRGFNRPRRAVVVADSPARISLPNRRDCYHGHVAVFQSWAAANGYYNQIDAIPRYFQALNESNYKAGTVRMKRQAVLNRLRQHMESQGLSMEEHFQLERLIKRLNAAPETRPPVTQKTGVQPNRIVSPIEFEKCLQKAGSLRQALFLKYLWITGARVSELTGAQLRNCKREGETVHITVRGKGNKERVLIIPGTLYDEIRRTFPSEQWLFETAGGKPYATEYVSNQIRKITRRAIGRPLGAHSFRHSFATRKIQETGKIKAVSTYLGHSSVSTTMNLYVHEQLTEAELFS